MAEEIYCTTASLRATVCFRTRFPFASWGEGVAKNRGMEESEGSATIRGEHLGSDGDDPGIVPRSRPSVYTR